MKVGFYLADQNPHRDRSRGITVYADALLRELSSRGGIQITTLTSESSYHSSSPSVADHRLPFRTETGVLRLLADHFHPIFFRQPQDIWHYPKGHLPAACRYSGPIVGTVHDVILQHYADNYPNERTKAQYAYWLFVLRNSLARFDAVLTLSEYSRTKIIEFCERHQIKCPPITVAYPATEWTSQAGSENSKEDYVLHLASKEPHKQTERLLSYWQEFERSDTACPKLLVIGNLTDRQKTQYFRLKNAEHLPPLPRELLLRSLGNARALLLPSEVEGFGLPALEAYAVGTPVAFVKATAVEEVLMRKTPGGFKLLDFGSFHDALQAVLEMDKNTVEAIRLRLAAIYTWERCVDRSLQVYGNVIDERIRSQAAETSF